MMVTVEVVAAATTTTTTVRRVQFPDDPVSQRVEYDPVDVDPKEMRIRAPPTDYPVVGPLSKAEVGELLEFARKNPLKFGFCRDQIGLIGLGVDWARQRYTGKVLRGWMEDVDDMERFKRNEALLESPIGVRCAVRAYFQYHRWDPLKFGLPAGRKIEELSEKELIPQVAGRLKYVINADDPFVTWEATLPELVSLVGRRWAVQLIKRRAGRLPDVGFCHGPDGIPGVIPSKLRCRVAHVVAEVMTGGHRTDRTMLTFLFGQERAAEFMDT